jgi:Fe-S cluster assembly protein SufB
VPQDIKTTFDRLGVPDAERKYLAGLGAQYESEVVYHRLKDQWAAKGVIFLNQIQN